MKNFSYILLSVAITLMSLILILISIALYEFLPIDMAVVLLVLSGCTFIIALSAAIVLDYESGEYECKKCGHKFTPTLSAYIFGAHTLTTRYLKCPHCGEKSFCKRRLSE